MPPIDVAAFAANSQYINGQWQPGSGASIDVFNPAGGEVIVSLPSSSADDVTAALRAASDAQATWGRMSIVQRGDYLRAIADLFAANQDALEELLVLEVGKPRSQAHGEVEFAKALFRYHAEWDRRLEGEILPGDVPGEVIHLLRTPVGVVGAICPWNFPLAVLSRKVAPALLTGNTVVAKPSEITPLTTLYATRLIDQHIGLPSGVFNVVTGAAQTGAALVESPLTSMITFTGHRDTGKKVMAAASANLTRVSLELGGKAPAIVWKDADLELAVSSILTARHVNAGQVCTSAERVLVHHDVLDQFTERYIGAVRALRLGDPTGDVDVGPLASIEQLQKTSAALDNAVREGATIVGSAQRPTDDALSRGYWFAPVVLRSQPGMSIMTEETFGPITPIAGIGSLEEALQVSNDSRYGLSAYLYSRDYQTIMRTVNELNFGEIYINRTLGESVHAHHAGFKESGIGGEDGKWGILRYTQIKTAYHHYGEP